MKLFCVIYEIKQIIVKTEFNIYIREGRKQNIA